MPRLSQDFFLRGKLHVMVDHHLDPDCDADFSFISTAAAATAPKHNLRETAALHSEILARLGPSPIAEDQLARDIRANASDIAPVLIDLELDGKILRQAGGLLSRIN